MTMMKNPNPKGTQSEQTKKIEELLLAGVPPVHIYEQLNIGRSVVAGISFRMRERGIQLPKTQGRWSTEQLSKVFPYPIVTGKLDPDVRKIIVQTLIENNNSLAIRKYLAEKYKLTASQVNTIAYQVKAVESNKTNPAMDVTFRPGKPIAADVTLPSKVGNIARAIVIEETDNITTILTLRNNDCRYPIGKVNDIQRFCGDRVMAKSSYCEAHHKIVWLPSKAR